MADQAPETTASTQQPESQTYPQIAASHIDTLSRVNQQLPKLLTYFAATISQLTNNPIETPVTKDKPDNIESRQEALWLMALYVGASIKEIREELVEQINHLERYGVIPSDAPRYGGKFQSDDAKKKEGSEQSVVNGGFGNFDVGVLNARAASGLAGHVDMLDRLNNMLDGLMKKTGMDQNGDEMAVDG